MEGDRNPSSQLSLIIRWLVGRQTKRLLNHTSFIDNSVPDLTRLSSGLDPHQGEEGLCSEISALPMRIPYSLYLVILPTQQVYNCLAFGVPREI